MIEINNNSKLGFLNYIILMTLFILSVKESKSSFFNRDQRSTPMMIPGSNDLESVFPENHFGSFPFLFGARSSFLLPKMLISSSLIERREIESSEHLRLQHQMSRQEWRKQLEEHLEINERSIKHALSFMDVAQLKELVEERLRLDAQKKLLDEDKDFQYLKLKEDIKILKENDGIIQEKLEELENEKKRLEQELERLQQLMPSNESLQIRVAHLEEEKEVVLIQFHELADLTQMLENQIKDLQKQNEQLHLLNLDILEKEKQSAQQFALDLDDAIQNTLPEEVYRFIGKKIYDTEKNKRLDVLKETLNGIIVTYKIPGDDSEKLDITTRLPEHYAKFMQEDLGL